MVKIVDEETIEIKLVSGDVEAEAGYGDSYSDRGRA